MPSGGDGRHMLKELIDHLNTSPLRAGKDTLEWDNDLEIAARNHAEASDLEGFCGTRLLSGANCFKFATEYFSGEFLGAVLGRVSGDLSSEAQARSLLDEWTSHPGDRRVIERAAADRVGGHVTAHGTVCLMTGYSVADPSCAPEVSFTVADLGTAILPGPEFDSTFARMSATRTALARSAPGMSSLALARSSSLPVSTLAQDAWNLSTHLRVVDAHIDAALPHAKFAPELKAYESAQNALNDFAEEYCTQNRIAIGKFRQVWSLDKKILKWQERVYWHAGDNLSEFDIRTVSTSTSVQSSGSDPSSHRDYRRPARVYVAPFRPSLGPTGPMSLHVFGEGSWGQIPESVCHCGEHHSVFEPYNLTQPHEYTSGWKHHTRGRNERGTGVRYRSRSASHSRGRSRSPSAGSRKSDKSDRSKSPHSRSGGSPTRSSPSRSRTGSSKRPRSSSGRALASTLYRNGPVIPCRHHNEALSSEFPIGQHQWSGIGIDPIMQRTYVPDQRHHRVLVFDESGGSNTSGKPLHVLGSHGNGKEQMDSPADVACSPDGNLIAVADGMNHRVQLWDTRSNTLAMHRPLGAEKDGQGVLQYSHGVCFIPCNPAPYVAVTDGGYFHGVTIFDLRSGRGTKDSAVWSLRGPEGQTSGAFLWPAGVAWNPQRKNLIVADKDNERLVEIYLPRGVLI